MHRLLRSAGPYTESVRPRKAVQNAHGMNDARHVARTSVMPLLRFSSLVVVVGLRLSELVVVVREAEVLATCAGRSDVTPLIQGQPMCSPPITALELSSGPYDSQPQAYGSMNRQLKSPEWMSSLGPIVDDAMAEHSMCQPGRPRPHGDSHTGSPGLAAFHSAKSYGVKKKRSQGSTASDPAGVDPGVDPGVDHAAGVPSRRLHGRCKLGACYAMQDGGDWRCSSLSQMACPSSPTATWRCSSLSATWRCSSLSQMACPSSQAQRPQLQPQAATSRHEPTCGLCFSDVSKLLSPSAASAAEPTAQGFSLPYVCPHALRANARTRMLHARSARHAVNTRIAQLTGRTAMHAIN